MIVNSIFVNWYVAMIDSIHTCHSCQSALSQDEIALTKKLINRGTTKYYCISCLAKAFDVSERDLENKIQYFKDSGCTLFHSMPY